MIPVTLVTGFLGAGKTTLLDRMTRIHSSGTVYLVNEFSPKDVDGRRLSLKTGRLQTVAGGSIFCRCKVTDFLNILRRTAEEYPDCPGLVIEASGIADPAVFPKMLQETGLSASFELRDIICVVDPGTLPKLLHTLPNVRSQITVASLIIVNKVDVFSLEEIEKVIAVIKDINFSAVVCSAVECEVPAVFLKREQRLERFNLLQGEYAKCADPNYASVTLSLGRGTDWEKLRSMINETIRGLYRAKGRIPTPAGVLEVDFSSGRWDTAQSADSSDGELVLIASGSDREGLEQLRQAYG